ncbi:MAG TPA: hypothetical protein VLM37_11975 [Fibrobacteraceae bacterium]|nr:hypothetical protein [Fibrobacteraceae bacterium]
MNLDTLDLLTQKIEKALGTIRRLRDENLNLSQTNNEQGTQIVALESKLATLQKEQERLEAELEQKQTEAGNLSQELNRREHEITLAKSEVERRVTELNQMQESLQEKESKIQIAATRLEQVMDSLEQELDVRVRAPEEELVNADQVKQEEKEFGDPEDLFGQSEK